MRSKATLVALAVSAAILVLGPLALTLLRAEDYASTTELHVTENPLERQLPAPIRLSYLSALIKVRDLQRGVRREVDWPEDAKDLPEYVSIQPASDGGDDAYVLRARAPTADQAHALASVTAREVLRTAENAARLFFGVELKQIEEQLRSDDLERSRRLELSRQRDRLAAVVSGKASIYESTATPATLPRERFADRLLGGLPGQRAERPNPLWACLAGAALAVALLVWVLALSPARGPGARSGRA